MHSKNRSCFTSLNFNNKQQLCELKQCMAKMFNYVQMMLMMLNYAQMMHMMRGMRKCHFSTWIFSQILNHVFEFPKIKVGFQGVGYNFCKGWHMRNLMDLELGLREFWRTSVKAVFGFDLKFDWTSTQFWNTFYHFYIGQNFSSYIKFWPR